MRTLRTYITIIMIITSVASAGNPTGAKRTYDALVERIKSDDRTVDLDQLRRAAGDAGIVSDIDARTKLMSAARSRNFEQMAVAADAVLKSNYADLDAHYFARIAATQLGRKEKAEFHRWVEIGLLTSLRKSGDGKSAENAMKVISVDEEYFILRMMGQQPGRQALRTCRGNPCDILTATDPESNQEQKWYFDVSIPMRRMSRELGEN